MADYINWDTVPLGDTVDRVIAESLNTSVSRVWSERTKRGIPAVSKHIVWDDVPLGTVADETLGMLLGCSRQAVHQQRTKRKIPAYHTSSTNAS